MRLPFSFFEAPLAGLLLAGTVLAAGPAVTPAPAGVPSATMPVATPVALSAEQITEFRTYLRHAQQDAGPPGMAVAVVQPGKVIFSDTFGTRAPAPAGTPAPPVTASTRFALGPATGAFNSLLVARLAAGHIVDLGAPARRCWDDFRLADTTATKTATLRNLLAMDAGISPTVDQAVRPDRATPADLFAALAQLPDMAQPGTSFNFSEASAAAAGYLGVLAANHLRSADEGLPAAYAALAQTQLFGPLGMGRSTFDAPVADDDTAIGFTHGTSGNWTPAPISAAGGGAYLPVRGLRASVADVAAWLRLELSGGLDATGQRLVAEGDVQARWVPELSRPGPQFGEGWERRYERGLEVVFCGGEQDGQSALLVIVPKYRTAAVVLANGGGRDAATMLEDVRLNFADWLREAAGDAAADK